MPVSKRVKTKSANTDKPQLAVDHNNCIMSSLTFLQTMAVKCLFLHHPDDPVTRVALEMVLQAPGCWAPSRASGFSSRILPVIQVQLCQRHCVPVKANTLPFIPSQYDFVCNIILKTKSACQFYFGFTSALLNHRCYTASRTAAARSCWCHFRCLQKNK